jgi:hypothetical protein
MSGPEYKPVPVVNWILTFIILAIPLLNLIMLIIWALGGTPYPSKRTFAQANFVILIIAFCIGIVLALVWPNLAHHKPAPGPAV